jgi:hypothetical protein
MMDDEDLWKGPDQLLRTTLPSYFLSVVPSCCQCLPRQPGAMCDKDTTVLMMTIFQYNSFVQ